MMINRAWTKTRRNRRLVPRDVRISPSLYHSSFGLARASIATSNIQVAPNPAAMTFHQVKVGGSLIGCAKEVMRSLGRISGHGFLVVPGGGPMADLVRELWSMGQLSLEASHWMAVLAMEQYAYLLADGTGAAMTDKVGRVSGVAVLRPYGYSSSG